MLKCMIFFYTIYTIKTISLSGSGIGTGLVFCTLVLGLVEPSTVYNIFTILGFCFIKNDYVMDSPNIFQIFFQDSATPVMESIVDLHNDITVFLILTLIIVFCIIFLLFLSYDNFSLKKEEDFFDEKFEENLIKHNLNTSYSTNSPNSDSSSDSENEESEEDSSSDSENEESEEDSETKKSKEDSESNNEKLKETNTNTYLKIGLAIVTISIIIFFIYKNYNNSSEIIENIKNVTNDSLDKQQTKDVTSSTIKSSQDVTSSTIKSAQDASIKKYSTKGLISEIIKGTSTDNILALSLLSKGFSFVNIKNQNALIDINSYSVEILITQRVKDFTETKLIADSLFNTFLKMVATLKTKNELLPVYYQFVEICDINKFMYESFVKFSSCHNKEQPYLNLDNEKTQIINKNIDICNRIKSLSVKVNLYEECHKTIHKYEYLSDNISSNPRMQERFENYKTKADNRIAKDFLKVNKVRKVHSLMEKDYLTIRTKLMLFKSFLEALDKRGL